MKTWGVLLWCVLAGCGPAEALLGPQPMLDESDHDRDGYSPPEDCDDENSSLHPGAVDVPGDGIDQDCSGSDAATEVDTDADSDSDTDSDVDSDTDADADSDTDTDTDPPTETGDTATPPNDTGDTGGAPCVPTAEICDGLDQDCDGLADNGLDVTMYTDADGDSFGDLNAPVVLTCGQLAGPNLVFDTTDCDDGNAQTYPGTAPNELNPNGCYKDDDFDDWGDSYDPTTPNGVTLGTDCHDGDAGINPAAVDLVDDGVDQDCNGLDLHAESCAGGYSKVYGSFVGPEGSTITQISGERIPNVGVDDQILWQVWTTGSPAGMTVTFSGNRVDFVLNSCVDDAATWGAGAVYTDAFGAVQYDCQNFGFTGTWTVEFDNDIQTVTTDVWDLINGSCNAAW